MAENKLLAEITQIIRENTVWNATATTRDLVSCKSAGKEVLAKMLEVVEGAGLTPEVILTIIRDNYGAVDEPHPIPVGKIAQAQLQAIINAIKEE